MSAEEHFKTAGKAWESVSIPAQFELGSRTTSMTAASISKALRDANLSITNRARWPSRARAPIWPKYT